MYQKAESALKVELLRDADTDSENSASAKTRIRKCALIRKHIRKQNSMKRKMTMTRFINQTILNPWVQNVIQMMEENQTILDLEIQNHTNNTKGPEYKF